MVSNSVFRTRWWREALVMWNGAWSFTFGSQKIFGETEKILGLIFYIQSALDSWSGTPVNLKWWWCERAMIWIFVQRNISRDFLWWVANTCLVFGRQSAVADDACRTITYSVPLRTYGQTLSTLSKWCPDPQRKWPPVYSKNKSFRHRLTPRINLNKPWNAKRKITGPAPRVTWIQLKGATNKCSNTRATQHKEIANSLTHTVILRPRIPLPANFKSVLAPSQWAYLSPPTQKQKQIWCTSKLTGQRQSTQVSRTCKHQKSSDVKSEDAKSWRGNHGDEKWWWRESPRLKCWWLKW